MEVCTSEFVQALDIAVVNYISLKVKFLFTDVTSGMLD